MAAEGFVASEGAVSVQSRVGLLVATTLPGSSRNSYSTRTIGRFCILCKQQLIPLTFKRRGELRLYLAIRCWQLIHRNSVLKVRLDEVHASLVVRIIIIDILLGSQPPQSQHVLQESSRVLVVELKVPSAVPQRTELRRVCVSYPGTTHKHGAAS